jgi:hypothetical protein
MRLGRGGGLANIERLGTDIDLVMKGGVIHKRDGHVSQARPARRLRAVRGP